MLFATTATQHKSDKYMPRHGYLPTILDTLMILHCIKIINTHINWPHERDIKTRTNGKTGRKMIENSVFISNFMYCKRISYYVKHYCS